MPFEEQVVLIWAATNGYFDEVGAEKASERGEALLSYINKLHREEIFSAIRMTGELSEETEAALKNVTEKFSILKTQNK